MLFIGKRGNVYQKFPAAEIEFILSILQSEIQIRKGSRRRGEIVFDGIM